MILQATNIDISRDSIVFTVVAPRPTQAFALFNSLIVKKMVHPPSIFSARSFSARSNRQFDYSLLNT